MKIKSGMFFVIFIWIWTDVLKLYPIRRRKRKEIFCLFGFLASRNITHYYNYYYYYSKSYTTIPQIRAEYYLVFWKKNCATYTQIMKKRKNNDSVRAIIYLVTYFCCRFTFVLLNELVNKETQFTFKCLVHLAKIGILILFQLVLVLIESSTHENFWCVDSIGIL